MVAKRARCSKTAVSLVLHNKGRISSDVRTRILDVAQKLGYVMSGPGRKPCANGTGKTRQTSRIRTVPLIAYQQEDPDRSPHFSRRLAGIREVLSRADLTLGILLPETPSQFLEQIAELKHGALFTGGFRLMDTELRKAIVWLGRNHPTVLVGNYFEESDGVITSVRGDYEMSGIVMAKKCLEAGRHSVVSVIQHFEPICNEREKGMRQIFDVSGVRYSSLRYETAAPLDGLWDEITRRHGEAPGAVISGGATIWQLSEDLTRRGLRIPEDVALLAFTPDLPKTGNHPPVATVLFDEYEIGRLAARTWWEAHQEVSFAQRKVLLPPVFCPGASFPAVNSLQSAAEEMTTK